MARSDAALTIIAQLGNSAEADANPFFRTSSSWEAFEVGRAIRAQLGAEVLAIRPSRGSSYRATIRLPNSNGDGVEQLFHVHYHRDFARSGCFHIA